MIVVHEYALYVAAGCRHRFAALRFGGNTGWIARKQHAECMAIARAHRPPASRLP